MTLSLSLSLSLSSGRRRWSSRSSRTRACRRSRVSCYAVTPRYCRYEVTAKSRPRHGRSRSTAAFWVGPVPPRPPSSPVAPVTLRLLLACGRERGEGARNGQSDEQQGRGAGRWAGGGAVGAKQPRKPIASPLSTLFAGSPEIRPAGRPQPCKCRPGLAPGSFEHCGPSPSLARSLAGAATSTAAFRRPPLPRSVGGRAVPVKLRPAGYGPNDGLRLTALHHVTVTVAVRR